MNKFPNQSGAGIFDIGKLVNSKLKDLRADNSSNLLFYKVELNDQWKEATTTGSIVKSGSGLILDTYNVFQYTTFDGYETFPTAINTRPSDGFPVLSDAWQVTQSVLIDDIGETGFYADDYYLPTTNKTVTFVGNYSDGTTSTVTRTYAASGDLASDKIKQIPSSPGHVDFPLSTVGLVSYNYSCGGGYTYQYVIECENYYDPVRVAYKNKYGQLDWMTFTKRSDRSFSTDQRVYQTQLGSWNANTLDYNTNTARTQRYIVDTNEELVINSGWLSEEHSIMLKQLLVTDEAYQVIDGDYYPLTIKTDNVRFKTGTNDKLVNYTLVFEVGSPYKLII
jgi:hypothetical protein